MSQVVDFLNEAKTFILQPLKETSQGSDRLMQPWRGMARSILVQPIRKSLSAVIGKFKGGSLRYGKRKMDSAHRRSRN